MISLLAFLFIYIIGGLTLIPLILVGFLTHAYFTFPIYDDTAYREEDPDSIIQPGDDVDAISRVQSTLGEKFQPRANNEADTFSGYFYCSREYVERWWQVQGKPPERATPVGSTTVSAASPSVYQSMYRSIFERKPVNSPIENKGVGKPQKRGGNVFYIVLRYGHLMLFDDEEQLEVRHVVSLAHHAISCYSGGDETPEGELFIKRNALCLSRRTDVGEVTPDGKPSKPFFLYTENCSAKEDFYFAMLRNQERKLESKYNPPIPLQYDVKDIITLVQRLHSSEEQLQTRWINAVIGRVFLGLYKTPEVSNFVRSKITKKISRVKTPSFLSKISLRHLDMGEAAPVITNPRLKDLTVDGEMVVEFDVKYSGNFRIEVATTARIELGTRFKAREVNLLLAVLLKRVEGHAMVRIKPPPSNRLWLTFSTMPKMDMHVEPIVSARQITYTLILRQIENRIKEVVAESLVFPNWDDSPFFSTEGKPWRGGIWADNSSTEFSDAGATAAQEGDVDEVANIESQKVGNTQGEEIEPILDLPLEESITAPVMDTSQQNTLHSRKSAKSMFNMVSSRSNGSSTSIDTRPSAPETPKVLRPGTFASASSPVVSTDATHADAVKYSSTPPEHSHAMAAVSALSQSPSSGPTLPDSPLRLPRVDKQGSLSSISSGGSENSEKGLENSLTPQGSHNPQDLHSSFDSVPYPPSPASISNSSFRSEAPSIKSFGHDSRRETSMSSSSAKSTASEPKRLSLAAVTNAAATAKKWGWNALQRQTEQRSNSIAEETPSRPLVMGRGQPLPPPGVPLPHPEKKTKTAPIPVPKRKAIPPPQMQPRKKDSGNEQHESNMHRHPVPPPLLPQRRERPRGSGSSGEEGLFVVAAPSADSEPSTPLNEQPEVNSYMAPWVEDEEDVTMTRGAKNIPDDLFPRDQPPQLPKRSPQEAGEKEDPDPPSPKSPAGAPRLPRRRTHESKSPQREDVDPPSPGSPGEPPRLPKRRAPHRLLSSSPEEDSHKLPSYILAQEGEARSRSHLVDEDAGL